MALLPGSALPSSTLGREEIIQIIRMENVVCGAGMEGLALAQEGQGARGPATELTALGRDIEHGKRASRGPLFGVTEAAERNKTIRIVCVIRECMIVPDSQILGCADHLVKYREVVDSMPPAAWPHRLQVCHKSGLGSSNEFDVRAGALQSSARQV
jgi:hypothetical protein